MKNYDISIYRQHLQDIPKSDDPLKIETYLKGVVDIANGFNTEEQASGVLDKNDIIQECYLALLQAWSRINWDAIRSSPREEQQPQVWAFIKKSVKLKAREHIHNVKDGQRIPHHKRWELVETKDLDDFLTQLFPPDFFADNAESLGLTYEDHINRYDIEQLGIGLDNVMSKYLSNKEKLILESCFGVDRPKISSKKIAQQLGITVSNVDKTKHVALNKLRTEEIKNYLKTFYDLG